MATKTRISTTAHDMAVAEIQTKAVKTRMDNEMQQKNAAIMESMSSETKKDAYFFFAEYSAKLAENVAFRCLIKEFQVEKGNVDASEIFSNFSSAKTDTKEFSLIFTESKNDDGKLTDSVVLHNSKGEERKFWLKGQKVESAKDVIRAYKSWCKYDDARRISAKAAAKVEKIQAEKAAKVEKAASIGLTAEQIAALQSLGIL